MIQFGFQFKKDSEFCFLKVRIWIFKMGFQWGLNFEKLLQLKFCNFEKAIVNFGFQVSSIINSYVSVKNIVLLSVT